PVTMSIAMGASKGLQIWGQRQMTKAQFGALANQRDAQNEEIAGKAGREMGERVKQGRAERARLRVAGGEAGITGNSFAASLMDAAFQQNEDVTAIGKDAEYAQRGSGARFQSGLASINNPGFFENALQIATSAVGGYATGLQIKEAREG
ncbi:hypothetical protein LCGC14_2742100, partial [marine sediment metagenome]